MAKASPEEPTAHDEGKQERDRSKGSKELSTVWCVRFCNRAENLGLGEVSTAGEQDIPGVGKFQRLKDVKDGKENRCNAGECPEDEQPRLVSETGCHEGNGQRKSKDEQEGLQSG